MINNQLTNKGLNTNRVFYLDNLKILLTILVILHHVAITFGGEGHFIINVSGGSDAVKLFLTAFLAINQSYFMGIFFSISAFFSYKSIVKKGKKTFITGKIMRLMLPATVYFLIVNPLLFFIIKKYYLKLPSEDIYYSPGLGALWFIAALAIFDIIFANIFFKKTHNKTELPIPNFSKAITYSLIIACLSWVVRIVFKVGDGILLGFQPAHFPQYIFAYAIGINASKYNWLNKLKAKKYKWFVGIGLLLIFVFFVGVALTIVILKDISYAFGGFNIISLLYCLWEETMFISFLFGFVSLFKVYFNKSNALLKIMSESSYLTYIIHSGVIAILVMILDPLNLNYMIYLFLAACLSVIFAFICGICLKPIFNL